MLQALVGQPPAAESALSCEDPLGVPRVQAEGAYGNGPIRERVQRAGFQLPVPSRSKAQPGVGAIRNAVERCHNGFAQCGRVFRRCDRWPATPWGASNWQHVLFCSVPVLSHDP